MLIDWHQALNNIILYYTKFLMEVKLGTSRMACCHWLCATLEGGWFGRAFFFT